MDERHGLEAKIAACHADGQGSIPGTASFSFLFLLNKHSLVGHLYLNIPYWNPYINITWWDINQHSILEHVFEHSFMGHISTLHIGTFVINTPK